MTIWLVTWDWGDYGNGISGAFSTKEKAEAYVAATKAKGGFGTHAIEEINVDEAS